MRRAGSWRSCFAAAVLAATGPFRGGPAGPGLGTAVKPVTGASCKENGGAYGGDRAAPRRRTVLHRVRTSATRGVAGLARSSTSSRQEPARTALRLRTSASISSPTTGGLGRPGTTARRDLRMGTATNLFNKATRPTAAVLGGKKNFNFNGPHVRPSTIPGIPGAVRVPFSGPGTGALFFVLFFLRTNGRLTVDRPGGGHRRPSGSQ